MTRWCNSSDDTPPLSALELSFTPVDNQRLANLCGVLDENLKQVESVLDVSIARRGETFSIAGAPPQTALAAEALRRFYAQAGSALNLEEVQLGLIEVANPTGEDDADQPPLITRRRDLHARTPHQAQYLRQIREHDITFGIGPAGTGKTYLAVAAAVDAFERDAVKRIVLVRPAVEAGERLGFLPGALEQKVDPYLRPLYDALYDMLGFERVGRLMEKGVIELAPLAYMRGRTLNESFIILDEAQNTSTEQMKMFLTRIGFNAKAVITGDLTQTDLPRSQKSGLREASEVLADIRGISFMHFTAQDVVRNPLVQRIVEAYAARTDEADKR